MSIYIQKNGVKQKLSINANDVQLLDIDGKYASKNLEDAMKEISGGTSQNMTKIQTKVDELDKKINDATNVVPSVNYGMNNVITNDGTVSALSKFTFQGRTIINLLGSSGNCEDLSKLTIIGGNTLTLNSTDKVYGTNSVDAKRTSSAEMKAFNIISNYNNCGGKYFFLRSKIKAVTGGAYVSLSFRDTTSNTLLQLQSNSITDTAVWRNSIIRGQAPTGTNYLFVFGALANLNDEALFDCIELVEISKNDYNNLTDQQLLDKYPYVEGYTCLKNPYVEVRHDNLVMNGNGEEGVSWWKPKSMSLSTENGYIKCT
jgi:hypothetical protein